ncbi:O-acyltransferase like protein-like [Drosophila pseudoobscura]|uniref:O-acyltransferase like protein-like n=1 Tax=Drosophila pseudoobscura pseudoobscura TaxID=46245 RepID=A0A6I8UYW4_DROPS|nr:O-acyltransferase like protein [Drosophila pseudoobscura]XP_033239191.1 O-acyltransferase like protein [Drosophila pseudoobscura]
MASPLLVLFLAVFSAGSTVSHELQPTPTMDRDHYMAASRLRSLVTEFVDYYQNITLADLNLYQDEHPRLTTDQDLECLKDLALTMQDLSSGGIWALRMFDSWGSLPSGMLYGNMLDLGNYDECLNVDHAVTASHSVRGKYCFAQVSLAASISSLLNIKTAVCFPASCTAASMDTLLRQLFEKLLNVEIGADLQLVDESTCKTAQREPYDGLTIFIIVVLSVLCALMALATLYDYFFAKDQKTLSPVVKAFSARANCRTLFQIVDTKSNPNVIACLHGMRCLSFVWVVFGHVYLVAVMGPVMNYVDFPTWYQTVFSMLIKQGVYAVDTFFFLSGLLLVLIALRTMERTKGKLNIPLMYLNRYLRLTPLLALAIPIYMRILPILGDGPLYGTVSFDNYASCSDTWYLTLLYVQNYATDSICVSHSWYLAVDMQLYIVSPFLLIALYKWGRRGAAGILVLMLLLASCLFSMMVIKNISTGSLENNPMKKLYYSTHTRASPYLIGILFGYFLHMNRGKPFRLGRVAVFLGWLLSLALLFTCIFSVHGKGMGSLPVVEEAFYLTLSRIAWPLGLCWVVFACMNGYGGLANSFLSSPLWQPLSKLSYSAYIFHMVIESLNAGITRTNTYFSDYQMMLRFWSDFAFTVLFAFLMHILIEAPFGSLQSHFLQTRKPSPKPAEAATLPEGPTNKPAPDPPTVKDSPTSDVQE